MTSVSTWIIFVCLFTCFLKLSASEEEKTAKPGDNVTLQCEGPKDAEIDTVMLKWTRPDLSVGDVFSFKDNNIQDLQNESFRGRVELMDPQMKDGNFSVILKNVTIKDTGTYECYFGKNGNKRELINTINLTVTCLQYITGAGHRDITTTVTPAITNSGHVDVLAVGLPAGSGIVVVVVVVVFVLYKIFKKNNSNQGTGKRKGSDAKDGAELEKLRSDTSNPESSGPVAGTTKNKQRNKEKK